MRTRILTGRAGLLLRAVPTPHNGSSPSDAKLTCVVVRVLPVETRGRFEEIPPAFLPSDAAVNGPKRLTKAGERLAGDAALPASGPAGGVLVPLPPAKLAVPDRNSVLRFFAHDESREPLDEFCVPYDVDTIQSLGDFSGKSEGVYFAAPSAASPPAELACPVRIGFTLK